MELTPEILKSLPYDITNTMQSSSICLIVTNKCNLSCEYCFNYVRKYHEDMLPELAVAILDFYIYSQKKINRKYLCPQIVFFGGEPTLNHKTIFKVIDYFNHHKLDCVPRLVTNGVIPEHLLDRLIEEKFYFQISFDGIQSYLRKTELGTNVNPKIIKTIEKVAEANLPIFLRATIYSENVSYMKDIVRFAIEYNVNTVAFKPVVIQDNHNVQKTIKRPKINDYINNYFLALELAIEANINFYSVEIYEYNRKTKTYPPPLVCFPDGHIAFTIKYASINECQDAKSVIVGKYSENNKKIEFNGEVIENMIQNFLNNQKIHCINCIALEYCKGRRCFDLFATNRNLESYDNYHCNITRKILEKLNKYNFNNNPY